MPSHTHTLKRQSNLMFSEWGKKTREESKQENLELCVSRGRRRCGIVLLLLPLMHAHAPGRFNSTFDLLWHEIYYAHTHTDTVEHTHSQQEGTICICRPWLGQSKIVACLGQCIYSASPSSPLPLSHPHSSSSSLCLSVASNDQNFCPGTW